MTHTAPEIPAPDDTDVTTGESPRTPMASLRARRQAMHDRLQLDLAIPRYDPPIYVRFKPITQARLEHITKSVGKNTERDDRTATVNAAVLADCCVGLFERTDDADGGSAGRSVSINPTDRDADPKDWLTFRNVEQLTELFGLEGTTRASEVVRAIYATDGDVAAAATRLGTWSGYAVAQADEEFSGN